MHKTTVDRIYVISFHEKVRSATFWGDVWSCEGHSYLLLAMEADLYETKRV